MPTPAINSLPVLEDKKQLRKLGSILVSGQQGKMALPLTAVDIQAQVAGRVASVSVRQTFSNPYTDFLEAVYIFPLSGGVAVSKFEMKVGDRVIHGAVEERQEARVQYALAVQSGKRAALLEQERDDVFTVSVGNLPPGEPVEINLCYAERLPYFHDGKTELRLPLVIGDRYIPGTVANAVPSGMGTAEDTDLVPDASRITPPRLAPGAKADLQLALLVDIAVDGEEISNLSCSQHATSTSIKAGWLSVSLAREDEVMDRDFVLNWCIASGKISSHLHLYRSPSDANQGYGMLTLVPPRIEGFAGSARDVIFVVDRSGSMRGIKMSSAIRACSILLETLSPRDRFSILAFDDQIDWMPAAQPGTLIDADEDGLERGHKFLRTIDARGGTELANAMHSALSTVTSCPRQQPRVPIVVVLTDGEVGDESRVLKEIQTNLGEARVFTIGIDTAVNSGLLKRLAALGAGTAAFVQPGAELEKALINIGREIGVPLVTDLQFEFSDKKIVLKDLAPHPVPDLFAGRAVTVFFRMPVKKGGALSFEIKGKNHDGSNFQQAVTSSASEAEAISQLWAKAYVTQLEDQYRAGGADLQKLKQQIVDIAKAHSLLTRFTAFVVVDESEVVNKDGSHRTVVQPVAQPALWEQSQAVLAMPAAPASASPWRAMLGSGPTTAPNLSWNLDADAEAAQASRAQPSTSNQYLSQAQAAPMARENTSAAASPQEQQQQPQQNLPSKQNLPSSLMGQLVRQRKSGNAGGAPAAPNSPPASGQQSKELCDRIIELYRALEAVWSQVKSGQAASGNQLAQTRERLLKQLALSDCASELPQLQRFIRVDLQELVAALNSSDTATSDLEKLCATTQQEFRKVDQELRTKLRLDATTGATANFWETNI